MVTTQNGKIKDVNPGTLERQQQRRRRPHADSVAELTPRMNGRHIEPFQGNDREINTTIPGNMIWYDIIPSNMTWYLIWYDIMWHDIIWYDTWEYLGLWYTEYMICLFDWYLGVLHLVRPSIYFLCRKCKYLGIHIGYQMIITFSDTLVHVVGSASK